MPGGDAAGVPPERERRYRDEGWWGDDLLDEVVLAGDAARPALVDGDLRLTRGALADRADRAAGAFAASGLLPGDRVVLRLPNCVDTIVTVLGLVRAGIEPVLMVPTLGRRDLDHVVAGTGARGVIVEDRLDGAGHRAVVQLRERPGLRFAALLARRRHRTPPQPPDGIHDLADLLGRGAPAGARPVLPDRTADDVCFHLLSGGTSGAPKPIPRTHRDYLHMVRACAQATGLDRDTRYLAALPVAHNFALGCPGVLGTLAVGGTVVLVSPGAPAIAGYVARERITVTALVPGLAKALTTASGDLSSLRVLQVGGARLYGPDAVRLRERLGGGRVQQVYGMAEGVICMTRPDDPDDVVANTQGRPVSPGDEWRVEDAGGRPAAAESPGELVVTGPYTIRRYSGAPGEGDEAFTPDGWYRSGDVVRVHPSGNLVVEGRLREFVNRGGEKIALSEIETLLAGCPGLRDAAAVPVPDDLLGEIVGVAVVPSGPGHPTLRQVRLHLKGAGLAAHGLPERLAVLERIPTTAIGKPDRAALARVVAAAAVTGTTRPNPTEETDGSAHR